MGRTRAEATLKQQKDAARRLRACLDREVTHLRLGDWRELRGAEIELIGHISDLHGTVCTCCPRIAGAVAC